MANRSQAGQFIRSRKRWQVVGSRYLQPQIEAFEHGVAAPAALCCDSAVSMIERRRGRGRRQRLRP